MVHAAHVNRATARFILRSGSAASKGSSATPPSTRHFLIDSAKLLETELTPSAPTPNAFLIAQYLPHFLFARAAPSTSNRYSYPIKIRPNPFTTNEKTFSNRYDSFHIHFRATHHPLLLTDHSSLPNQSRRLASPLLTSSPIH